MHQNFDFSVGIYGAGHLCESFLVGLRQTTVQPVAIYNRTPDRIDLLRTRFRSLLPAKTLPELVARGGLVFLFVPANAVLGMADEVLDLARSHRTTFVSCVNGLSLSQIEDRYPKIQIIKAVPNVLWQLLQGITLVKVGRNVSSIHAEVFRKLVGRLSVLHDVDSEETFDRLSLFTSCGPGLFAELISQLFVGFAASTDTERALLLQSITSTGLYIARSKCSPESVVHEVARPGGLTEVGADALRKSLPTAIAYVRACMAEKVTARRDEFALQAAK